MKLLLAILLLTSSAHAESVYRTQASVNRGWALVRKGRAKVVPYDMSKRWVAIVRLRDCQLIAVTRRGEKMRISHERL